MVVLQILYYLLVPILVACGSIYSFAFIFVVKFGTISIEEEELINSSDDVIPNGRIHFFNKRISIPLHWFLNFYSSETICFFIDNTNHETVEFDDVTKEMRRKALEDILESRVFCIEEDSACVSRGVEDLEEGKVEYKEDDSLDENDYNVCSICLMKYGMNIPSF